MTTSPSACIDVQQYRRLEKHTGRRRKLAERLKLPPSPLSLCFHSSGPYIIWLHLQEECVCRPNCCAPALAVALKLTGPLWHCVCPFILIFGVLFGPSCGSRSENYSPCVCRTGPNQADHSRKRWWWKIRSLLFMQSELSIPGLYRPWPYCPLGKLCDSIYFKSGLIVAPLYSLLNSSIGSISSCHHAHTSDAFSAFKKHRGNTICACTFRLVSQTLLNCTHPSCVSHLYAYGPLMCICIKSIRPSSGEVADVWGEEMDLNRKWELTVAVKVYLTTWPRTLEGFFLINSNHNVANRSERVGLNQAACYVWVV